ncbi:hypothetical protein, partial [Nocardia asiatica]|uniref:hypothetical protein n=1 Tax=Nocardia asiatica TaxID=209252 RepID=UPI001C3F1934
MHWPTAAVATTQPRGAEADTTRVEAQSGVDLVDPALPRLEMDVSSCGNATVAHGDLATAYGIG